MKKVEKGYKQTQETKDKISKANKGKKHTPEDRARHTQNLLSFIKTPESERKRIDAVRKSNNVKIVQYTLNKHFIKTWDSIKEASEKTGIAYGTIRANLNKRRKTGNGFLWEYL